MWMSGVSLRVRLLSMIPIAQDSVKSLLIVDRLALCNRHADIRPLNSNRVIIETTPYERQGIIKWEKMIQGNT